MFTFTIREPLLLNLVVGQIVGWWMDHRRLQRHCYIPQLIAGYRFRPVARERV